MRGKHNFPFLKEETVELHSKQKYKHSNYNKLEKRKFHWKSP